MRFAYIAAIVSFTNTVASSPAEPILNVLEHLNQHLEKAGLPLPPTPFGHIAQDLRKRQYRANVPPALERRSEVQDKVDFQKRQYRDTNGPPDLEDLLARVGPLLPPPFAVPEDAN